MIGFLHPNKVLYVINKLFIIILFPFFPLLASAHSSHLKTSRDSLRLLLNTSPQHEGARRLQLLNLICHIGTTMGGITYIYTCWFALVKQSDVNSMNNLLDSIVTHYKHIVMAGSAEACIDRNRPYL